MAQLVHTAVLPFLVCFEWPPYWLSWCLGHFTFPPAVRIPLCPHPCQHWLLFLFLMAAILTELQPPEFLQRWVRWKTYLTASEVNMFSCLIGSLYFIFRGLSFNVILLRAQSWNQPWKGCYGPSRYEATWKCMWNDVEERKDAANCGF